MGQRFFWLTKHGDRSKPGKVCEIECEVRRKKIEPKSRSWIVICIIVAIALLLTGCHPRSYELNPRISYHPSRHHIEKLPSAFEKLSPEELKQEWAKELLIARSFAREMDLYRAITGFKRALILLPRENHDRHLEIEYDIILSYYLGNKYCDAIETFESGHISQASGAFPAFGDLLLILYDSYDHLDQPERANSILKLIETHHPETATSLRLGTALHEARIWETATLSTRYKDPEVICDFIDTYYCNNKCVHRAQTLNALLPGAGYYYVDQKKAALTSFTINALFIATAYHFFSKGNIGAGLITTSLETGWYIGGINGAGLAAKEWNETLYRTEAKELMTQQGLFPVLMFETAF